MNKTSKIKAKPLPPLMAKAFANLADAFDMSKPANLGGKFPFFVKGVDDRETANARNMPEPGENRARTAPETTNGTEGVPAVVNAPASAPRGCIQDSAELVMRLTRMVSENPAGKKGVAQLLGINESSMRTLLSNVYKGHPRKIMAAYNAYIEGVERQIDQVAAAGPNPANLDRMGKRYVLAGCMVELPDLAMAKVGRVDNGRWYLPTDTEPHHATCNQVRVLMRTYSESMGAFYWA